MEYNVGEIDRTQMRFGDSMAFTKYQLAQKKDATISKRIARNEKAISHLEAAGNPDQGAIDKLEKVIEKDTEAHIAALEAHIAAFDGIADIVSRVCTVTDDNGNVVDAQDLPQQVVEAIMTEMGKEQEEMSDPND